MLPIHYHEFRVTRRAEELGGGWDLQLLKDGRPVGGRVFVPDEYRDTEQTCAAAVKEGGAWLEAQPGAVCWAAYLETLS